MNNNYENVFSKPIVRIGRATLLIAAPLSFLPAIYIGMRYGAWPPVSAILTAWFLCASVYGVEYFMTPISYYPILGNAGTYMAFLSGNIANVRVPVALISQDVVGVEPGTNEGEIIATVGMAGSIITGIIVTVICAAAGTAIVAALPDAITKAFDYVLPAIFGALFALYAHKHPKYGAFSMLVALILVFGVRTLPTVVVVPICVFSAMAFAYWDTRRRTR